MEGSGLVSVRLVIRRSWVQFTAGSLWIFLSLQTLLLLLHRASRQVIIFLSAILILGFETGFKWVYYLRNAKAGVRNFKNSPTSALHVICRIHCSYATKLSPIKLGWQWAQQIYTWKENFSIPAPPAHFHRLQCSMAAQSGFSPAHVAQSLVPSVVGAAWLVSRYGS